MIAQTERLNIRLVSESDAVFMLELINSPKFHKYIGDRGVRTLDDVKPYIEERYMASYREHGYGLYAVELKNGTPMGVCGFVNRATLEHPDLGFALLPEFEGRGYAFEAAEAVMKFGRSKLGFGKVLAITTLDNDASIKLLEKLGFTLQRVIDQNGEQLNLFSSVDG